MMFCMCDILFVFVQVFHLATQTPVRMPDLARHHQTEKATASKCLALLHLFFSAKNQGWGLGGGGLCITLTVCVCVCV